MALYRQMLMTTSRLLCKQLNKTISSKNVHRWVAPTLHELKKRRLQIGEEPPTPRSSFLEWNYEAEVFAFGQRLGEKFDKIILKQALTHRSYILKKNKEAKENGIEETEILSNSDLIKEGSGIISNYLKNELRTHHPTDIVEAFHNYLTTTEMLSHVGVHMGLTDIILTSEFPVEKLTLADTFKAVVAALKQSQDLSRAELFVKDFLICQLADKELYDIWNPDNPVEYLNNLLKEQGVMEIEPRLCNQSASNTILANYQVGFYNNKKLIGIGWGENIEIAKETAALDAIQKIYYHKKV